MYSIEWKFLNFVSALPFQICSNAYIVFEKPFAVKPQTCEKQNK